jgi:uncharacterized protein YqgC (DUF456 family)
MVAVPSVALVVAVVVLVVAVVGSFVPGVPSGLLSLVGVLGYWVWSGFTEPGTVVVGALCLIAVVAVLTDLFAGVVAAKKGGASNLTVAVSVVAAILLSVVLGPLGFILGLPAAVLVITYWRTADRAESLRAAAYTTAGVLASAVVQALLTLTVLVGFVVAVVL